MRLEDFIHFDAERFLKSIPILKLEKERLEQELEAVVMVSAINTESSSIHVGVNSDATGETAIKIMNIREAIADIDRCLNVKEYAFNQLSKKECELLDGFFNFGSHSIASFVRRYSESNYISIAEVYRLRYKALTHLEEIIYKQ